jgi:glycosyltransferase involved in cell wall biosynthesis
MNILLQHSHLQHEISGVLTSIDELLPELASRPGVDVRVLSTKRASTREQISAVRWADVIMLNSNCLLIAIAGRLLARRTLLKLHYPQYQTVHWDFVPMSLRYRLVTEIRHLVGLQSGSEYKIKALGRLILRTLVALIVAQVCACSRYCADQSSLPRKVRVLPNPILIEPGRPSRDLTMLDVPYRFVFIGRVTHEKGWDTLVEAARIVFTNNRLFRVDIVGSGDAIDAMKRQVSDWGLSEHFRFLGRLEPAAVRGVLARALCAIVPSRCQETASYIPLEAAASRVASIVARVGGMPETAGPDCPSFSRNSAAELSTLMMGYLDSPVQALAAGHASYMRAVQQFSPRAIVDELLQLLTPNRTVA